MAFAATKQLCAVRGARSGPGLQRTAVPRANGAPRCQTRGARFPKTLAAAVQEVVTPPSSAAAAPAFQEILADFGGAGSQAERLQLLLQYGSTLPHMSEVAKCTANRVMGCTSQVWLTAELDVAGRVRLAADSDAALTRGLAAVVLRALSGLTPAELLEVDFALFQELGLGAAALTPSRNNGFLNMLEAARKRVRMLTTALPTFPSLLISADGLVPQGAFAEAQALFLHPEQERVAELASVLAAHKMGVVAHFYMDPEVQGVLTSAAASWPHIHISDSLVMADSAIKMAAEGCTSVAVLGVDFMSENVRAILDEAGYQDVQVYRMDSADIGCSLAEAAESPAYTAYLQQAASQPKSLHVVYINTSLRTKAEAHALVPTITCTSSNVVQTVLQAFAQVPDLTLWYGPDTYMGANLEELFTSLAALPDEEVQQLHPEHTQASIQALLPRLHYFREGTCIVHHIFGGEVTQLVAAAYGDAYLTAHFEVPGEMFKLAMAAKRRGMGVVGSTQNILDFIAAKLSTAMEQPFPERLQFVLGTESGMITAIVRRVESMLLASGRKDVQVEIVFPVSPDAVSTGGQATSGGAPLVLPSGLTIVPGAASGEGCSSEGGCASCPYMKMNSLSALMSVAQKSGSDAGRALLEAFKPREYADTVGGRSMAEAGCEPILHMRGFQKSGKLPPALDADILQRNA